MGWKQRTIRSLLMYIYSRNNMIIIELPSTDKKYRFYRRTGTFQTFISIFEQEFIWWQVVSLNFFYPMETYITHFLEEARCPKAPVLARHKVNCYILYAPQNQLTAFPPPHHSVWAKLSCVSWLSGWPRLPPHSTPGPWSVRAVKCLGPETSTVFSFA